jgi:hypothetical protein
VIENDVLENLLAHVLFIRDHLSFFLSSFLPFFLSSFLHSFLPSFLPSFLASFRLSSRHQCERAPDFFTQWIAAAFIEYLVRS